MVMLSYPDLNEGGRTRVLTNMLRLVRPVPADGEATKKFCGTPAGHWVPHGPCGVGLRWSRGAVLADQETDQELHCSCVDVGERVGGATIPGRFRPRHDIAIIVGEAVTAVREQPSDGTY